MSPSPSLRPPSWRRTWATSSRTSQKYEGGGGGESRMTLSSTAIEVQCSGASASGSKASPSNSALADARLHGDERRVDLALGAVGAAVGRDGGGAGDRDLGDQALEQPARLGSHRGVAERVGCLAGAAGDELRVLGDGHRHLLDDQRRDEALDGHPVVAA